MPKEQRIETEALLNAAHNTPVLSIPRMDLAKFLRDMAVACDVKDLPSGESVGMMIKILMDTKYRTLTKEEIQLAFANNFIGKYPERYEHYNNFGVGFLTLVLNAYLEYKRNIKIQANKFIEAMPVRANPSISPDVRADPSVSPKKDITPKQLCDSAYAAWCKGVTYLPYSRLYDYLYRAGLFNFADDKTADYHRQAIVCAKQDMRDAGTPMNDLKTLQQKATSHEKRLWVLDCFTNKLRSKSE